jgi:hypothetical protein
MTVHGRAHRVRHARYWSRKDVLWTAASVFQSGSATEATGSRPITPTGPTRGCFGGDPGGRQRSTPASEVPSRLAALRLAREGKVYDLGVLYDRTSWKWPGHNPGEVISFRTPEGVKRQQGVHIGEFHYLEDLARDQVYEFCYIRTTNKVKGTTAGFVLRPVAMR